MVVYDFQDQLAKGEAAERTLDTHFAVWFVIEAASDADQARGIDRWFTGRQSGKRMSVEYKTDWRAASTDNAFIELVNTATVEGAYTAPGWAYSSQADRIFYYCPGSGGEQVYLLSPKRLRQVLPKWLTRYKQRTVKNTRYDSTGLLVPLRELDHIALQVVNL